MVFNEPPTVLLYRAVQKPTAKDVVQVNFSLKKEGPAGVLVPLFIGTEPAEQFRLSLADKGHGMAVFQLAGFDALEELLVDLKNNGTTHVNFNAERDRPNPVPIDDVLRSLKNRLKG